MPKTVLWWDYQKPEQDTLWQSWIELGEELFTEFIEHPVPIDMRILKTMRRSSLGLDHSKTETLGSWSTPQRST